MPPSSRMDAALRVLRQGGVVVYPTDTLWGLGARVGDARAVDRVLGLKDRPSGQPISVAFSSSLEIEPYVRLSVRQRRWVRRLLPGPVTLLLPPSPWARDEIPVAILGHGRTIGVRVPDHPVARELARRAGPITATSANRHGSPPVQGPAEARRLFGKGVGCYLEDGPEPSGRASRIIDLTREPPVIVGR